MARKEKSVKKGKEAKGPFLSDRQRRVFLIILVTMFVAVPLLQNIRCKAACLKKVKTPYPEIACKYQCPWPWEKSK